MCGEEGFTYVGKRGKGLCVCVVKGVTCVGEKVRRRGKRLCGRRDACGRRRYE